MEHGLKSAVPWWFNIDPHPFPRAEGCGAGGGAAGLGPCAVHGAAAAALGPPEPRLPQHCAGGVAGAKRPAETRVAPGSAG